MRDDIYMDIVPFLRVIDNENNVIDILNIEKLKRIRLKLYTIHIKE